MKEAWAAGWRAKNKIAAQKKARQWSKPPSGEKGAGKRKPTPAASDPRKKGCICSSRGETGHWKGDPECKNVQSGKDPMHKPDKPRKASAKKRAKDVRFTEKADKVQETLKHETPWPEAAKVQETLKHEIPRPEVCKGSQG